jgi:hypothetical protein
VNGDEVVDGYDPLAVIPKGGRQKHREQAQNDVRSHSAIVRPMRSKENRPKACFRKPAIAPYNKEI